MIGRKRAMVGIRRFALQGVGSVLGDQLFELLALGRGEPLELDAATPAFEAAQAGPFDLHVVDHPARYLPQHEVVRLGRKNVDLLDLIQLAMMIEDRVLESRPAQAEVLERPQPVERRPEDQIDVRLHGIAHKLAAVVGVPGAHGSLPGGKGEKRQGHPLDPALFNRRLSRQEITSSTFSWRQPGRPGRSREEAGLWVRGRQCPFPRGMHGKSSHHIGCPPRGSSLKRNCPI